MDDITKELARLHVLNGADFIRQLKLLTSLSVFKPVEDEKDIFAAEGSHREDSPLLLDAARKAVALGNKVYILPNPKGIRTADFIFENKGIYKMFDLKTIHGKASVINRLLESVGQTNHVLLNITSQYNGSRLAAEIQSYFQVNTQAYEVMIFKGKQVFTIKRRFALQKSFVINFRKRYR